MNLHQGVIFVDESDSILIAIQSTWEEFLMHSRTVRAFQVVEINDRNFGCGIATDGPVFYGNVLRGYLGQIERLQAREGLIVSRNEELNRGGALTTCHCYMERIIAGNLAGLAGA